ncbi:hypothetical protein D8I35_05340 [Corticibacter populi]|uniref:Uncharacterized protein n=1 Tax=Corticibacter populi TaxID=1550736 RepID=A0A3M6R190_9BURK|nr:hypothetical protein D8I35_05340 [Corticibacter populi]
MVAAFILINHASTGQLLARFIRNPSARKATNAATMREELLRLFLLLHESLKPLRIKAKARLFGRLWRLAKPSRHMRLVLHLLKCLHAHAMHLLRRENMLTVAQCHRHILARKQAARAQMLRQFGSWRARLREQAARHGHAGNLNRRRWRAILRRQSTGRLDAHRDQILMTHLVGRVGGHHKRALGKIGAHAVRGTGAGSDNGSALWEQPARLVHLLPLLLVFDVKSVHMAKVPLSRDSRED